MGYPNDYAWRALSVCGASFSTALAIKDRDERRKELERLDSIFDPKGRPRRKEHFSQFCDNCPVSQNCLVDGFVHDEEGIWGGTRDATRKSLLTIQTWRNRVIEEYQEGRLDVDRLDSKSEIWTILKPILSPRPVPRDIDPQSTADLDLIELRLQLLCMTTIEEELELRAQESLVE